METEKNKRQGPHERMTDGAQSDHGDEVVNVARGRMGGLPRNTLVSRGPTGLPLIIINPLESVDTFLMPVAEWSYSKYKGSLWFREMFECIT